MMMLFILTIDIGQTGIKRCLGIYENSYEEFRPALLGQQVQVCLFTFLEIVHFRLICFKSQMRAGAEFIMSMMILETDIFGWRLVRIQGGDAFILPLQIP